MPIHVPAEIAPLRRVMSDRCGLLRSADGLTSLLAELDADAPETEGGRLARTAARLIAEAALDRQESRGAHQREDFPATAAPEHSVTRADRTAPRC